MTGTGVTGTAIMLRDEYELYISGAGSPRLTWVKVIKQNFSCLLLYTTTSHHYVPYLSASAVVKGRALYKVYVPLPLPSLKMQFAKKKSTIA